MIIGRAKAPRKGVGGCIVFTEKINSNPIDLTILQENHYYAFGLEMEGNWADEQTNAYTYNGKEMNEELGLNWLDYGFRYYDPSNCKFTSVDPAAEKYPDISTYVYVASNPINFIDPRGDTLRAVNQISAQRALGIIQSGIPSPSSANKLFSLADDGVTFNSISNEALNNALDGLNAEQAALVLGYAAMINGSETNVVEIVNRDETISEYGQGALSGGIKTGADWTPPLEVDIRVKPTMMVLQ